MPRRATGSARRRKGRWYARVTVNKKRLSFELSTCGADDEAKAEARTVVLAKLARDLDKAGHADIAPSLLERAAERDGSGLKDVLEAARRLCDGEASAPMSVLETFRSFGTRWTSGELHRKWPDHVRKKKSSEDDRRRLEAYVYPIVGDVPLREFSVSHAEAVMGALPREKLSKASRRHVAQAMNRILNLAAYPAKVIDKNPLPSGFLPKIGKPKAQSFLYPDEDARLLAHQEIPLAQRLFYGFLAREGMRRSEAGSLAWKEVDLERGAVSLDKNKTDDPRAWKLRPGVVRALRAWKEQNPPVDDDVPSSSTATGATSKTTRTWSASSASSCAPRV